MNRVLISLSLLATVSCSDGMSPSDILNTPPAFLEGDAAGLRFTTSISKATLSVGETATLTTLLRNPTSQRVRLTFGGCDIVQHIHRGREQVYPPPFACTAAITTLTLEPGEERTFTLQIRASRNNSERILDGVALTPGRYAGFAEMMNGEGRSSAAFFSVVP